MSFFNKIKNAVLTGTDDLVTGVAKFKNKKFMEGTVAEIGRASCRERVCLYV